MAERARGHARHAEIAGAGIAGLATATALAQRGWSVTVHERDAQLREIGAGIFLWPNGVGALRTLGAEAEATADGTRVESWDIRDERMRVLQGGPIAGAAYTVARASLHRGLLNAARANGVEVRAGSPVAGAEPEGRLRLASGEVREADLVVGADGIRSAVRAAVAPGARILALGYGAQRLFVERAEGDPATTNPEWWNGHRRIGISPCGPDHTYVYMFSPPADAAARRAPLDRELWSRAFPAAASIVARLPEQPQWREIEEVRCPRWSRGRVVMVGDAAHAMAPNLGQGACMAMASVIELAERLEGVAPEAGVAAWERERRHTVERIQRIAHAYSKLMTGWPGGLFDARSALVWGIGRSERFIARITGTG